MLYLHLDISTHFTCPSRFQVMPFSPRPNRATQCLVRQFVSSSVRRFQWVRSGTPSINDQLPQFGRARELPDDKAFWASTQITWVVPPAVGRLYLISPIGSTNWRTKHWVALMSHSYFYKYFMLGANVGWYRDPSRILLWFNHPFSFVPWHSPTRQPDCRCVLIMFHAVLPHICMRWTVPTAARRNDKGTSTAWEATWIDCAHTWIYMSTRPLGHWCSGLDKVHHM